MIRQHFLQQQRLNNNHERLLERYNRIATPQMSEFRTFGTSSLPGRNYDQHLNSINGNSRRRDSLVIQSRANIGPSGETYRWMGDGASENLPRNINSVMQHTRQQSIPLVHAERFEPVQVYQHPVFGPVPAYIRPVYNEGQHVQEIEDDDDDEEVKSHNSLKIDPKVETKTTSTTVKDNNNNVEQSINAPKGYISYANWKAKYENLIPVNPLLFNIYTQRTNGSINSYGQALYSGLEENVFSPTSSDTASISSELPREATSSTSRPYNRLQPQSFPSTITPRSLEPIRAGNKDDSSDDEESPPDSPVPYLSRSRPNPPISTPLSTTTPIITRSPISTRPLPVNNRDSTFPPLTTTSTSTIPPAPPMPSSTIPPAPPMPSSMIPPAPPMPSSMIPPAPPMPSSLLPSSSSTIYQTPSSLPIARSVPGPLSTTSSTAPYQTPSSVIPPSASSLAASTGKAVTFGGSTSMPVPVNDMSSSSDSDDEEKTKRRRRKKRQAAAGIIDPNGDSSSDD